MKSQKYIYASILRQADGTPNVNLDTFTSAQLKWHIDRLIRLGYIVESTSEQGDGGTGHTITNDGKIALVQLNNNLNPF